MPVNIEELKDAVRLLRDAGVAEAAIVAQLVLDLAAIAKFTNNSQPLTAEGVRKLLLLRLARHRAATYRPSSTIH